MTWLPLPIWHYHCQLLCAQQPPEPSNGYGSVVLSSRVTACKHIKATKNHRKHSNTARCYSRKITQHRNQPFLRILQLNVKLITLDVGTEKISNFSHLHPVKLTPCHLRKKGVSPGIFVTRAALQLCKRTIRSFCSYWRRKRCWKSNHSWENPEIRFRRATESLSSISSPMYIYIDIKWYLILHFKMVETKQILFAAMDIWVLWVAPVLQVFRENHDLHGSVFLSLGIFQIAWSQWTCFFSVHHELRFWFPPHRCSAAISPQNCTSCAFSSWLSVFRGSGINQSLEWNFVERPKIFKTWENNKRGALEAQIVLIETLN